MNKSYTFKNRAEISELYRNRVRFIFPLWGYYPFGDNFDFYLNFESEMVLEEKQMGRQMQGISRK